MEKLAAILEEGRLLGQSMQDEYRVFLYRLQSFYVSIKYYLSTDQLKEIDTFTEVPVTTPYYRKVIISMNPAERIV